MKIKGRPFKKGMKILSLLVTSLLIATVSAAVYYSLAMQPRVTVAGLLVKFDSSNDTPGASTISDSWSLLALKSYPNATLTYDKVLDINNTDDSNSHQIRLRHVVISPNSTAEAGNWTSIRFYLYAQNGTLITSFNYTQASQIWTVTPSQTDYYVVPQSEVWYLKVMTLSPATATVGKVLNIQIALDVQE